MGIALCCHCRDVAAAVALHESLNGCMHGGRAHLLDAAVAVRQSDGLADAQGKVGLQRSQRDPAILAAVHAIASMGATYIALCRGHLPLPRQRQPLRRLGQANVQAVACVAAGACH